MVSRTGVPVPRMGEAPTIAGPVPGRRRGRWRREWMGWLVRFQSVLGLVVVFVGAVLTSPIRNGEIVFLTGSNLASVVRGVSELGILAVGMTFVILIGGIDLSVGAVLGLSAVGSAVLLMNSDLPLIPAVLIVLVIGLAFGALQGFAVAFLGIQAFIVTLAGLQIARGLARLWSGGQGVDIVYGDRPGEASVAFSLLGERTFNGMVPIPVLIFVGVAGLSIVFLRISVFSRYLYAVGGNEKAARLSGVPVARIKILAFAICGLLAALAGIMHAGQLNHGSPNEGLGYELDAIAAVVIGGTSLAGGRGTMIGTVAGALLLGVLNNILALRGVDPDVQLLIKGLVIVAAAAVQRLTPRT